MCIQFFALVRKKTQLFGRLPQYGLFSRAQCIWERRWLGDQAAGCASIDGCERACVCQFFFRRKCTKNVSGWYMIVWGTQPEAGTQPAGSTFATGHHSWRRPSVAAPLSPHRRRRRRFGRSAAAVHAATWARHTMQQNQRPTDSSCQHRTRTPQFRVHYWPAVV